MIKDLDYYGYSKGAAMNHHGSEPLADWERALLGQPKRFDALTVSNLGDLLYKLNESGAEVNGAIKFNGHTFSVSYSEATGHVVSI